MTKLSLINSYEIRLIGLNCLLKLFENYYYDLLDSFSILIAFSARSPNQNILRS